MRWSPTGVPLYFNRLELEWDSYLNKYSGLKIFDLFCSCFLSYLRWILSNMYIRNFQYIYWKHLIFAADVTDCFIVRKNTDTK